MWEQTATCDEQRAIWRSYDAATTKECRQRLAYTGRRTVRETPMPSMVEWTTRRVDVSTSTSRETISRILNERQRKRRPHRRKRDEDRERRRRATIHAATSSAHTRAYTHTHTHTLSSSKEENLRNERETRARFVKPTTSYDSARLACGGGRKSTRRRILSRLSFFTLFSYVLHSFSRVPDSFVSWRARLSRSHAYTHTYTSHIPTRTLVVVSLSLPSRSYM